MAKKVAKKSAKKGFISVIIVSVIMLAAYSYSTTITKYIFGYNSTSYTRSEQGANAEEIDAIAEPIEIDLSEYMDDLFEYLQTLDPDELASYLENLLSEDLGDYLNETGLDAEEFMDLYGEDINDLLNTLSGEGFDSSAFDNFPLTSALGAVILAKLMFFVYETNPSNPWEDPNDTLFKISSYDEYDITSYDWVASSSLDNVVALGYDSGSSEIRKWKIKNPIALADDISTGVPTIFPTPRIMDYTLTSSPISPDAAFGLSKQSYLGGAIVSAEYVGKGGDFSNISYDLLYDSNDYLNDSYYEDNAITMSSYSGTDTAITACLKSPKDASSNVAWTTYRSSNPYFDAVATALASDADFVAATNTFTKMQAIINYVGENFVLNYESNNRPGSDEDPIEWFCENKETNFPFEFSSLITVLARLNDIPARYVSGYKWNDAIAALYGDAYDDPDEGSKETHPYRAANTYTWMEVFIPLTSTTGSWLEFDNMFSANATAPNFTSVPENDTSTAYNLKFNGDWFPSVSGYERFDGILPREIAIEVNITFEGSPITGKDVVMKDVSFGNEVLGTFTTNSTGIATGILSLQNLTSGPHILNFSTDYMGVSFGNVSIIDVLDDIDLFVDPVSPQIINTSSNPSRTIQVTGYAWDSETDKPAKNAVINVTARLRYSPFTAYSVVSKSAVTNSTGNFTINTALTALDQENYTININFWGVFNISSDIEQFPESYQSMLSGYTLMPQHGAAGYIDQKSDDIQLIDYDNFEAWFYINGTQQSDGTPVVTNRSQILEFNATTKRGGSGTSGQIQLYDLSEDRLIGNFYTASNGEGNYKYNLQFQLNTDWTAGPHLIRMRWANAPLPADPVYERFIWIFIREPIRVNQTSNYFYEGSGTGGSNFYNISVNGAGDTFNISGKIEDYNTKEPLSYTHIYYKCYDNVYIDRTDYLVGTYKEENSASNGLYYENFQMSGTSPLSLSPVRTDTEFRGEWNDLGDGWNNAWNSLWASFYGVKNDSSDGSFQLRDPLQSSFTATENARLFQPSYNSGNVRMRYTGDSINITCHFTYQLSNQKDAFVTLTDLTNGTSWYAITNINGNASFILFYGSHTQGGPHKYSVSLTYDAGLSSNLTKGEATWVVFRQPHTLTSYRTDAYATNLTRSVTNPTITVQGYLRNTTNIAYNYATISLWVKIGVQTYSASTYLVITSNTYSIANGLISIAFYARSDCPTGNLSLMIGFDGTINIPGGLNSNPALTYSESSLKINASTWLQFVVNDKPVITSSFDYDTKAFESIIPDWTNITISGSLNYTNNGTGISNEYLNVTFYNQDDSMAYTNATVLTNGVGQFNTGKIFVEAGWDLKYYTVSYGGKVTKYLVGANLVTEQFIL
jgi:transglutaminase-like putative cysteine protease